MDTTSAQLIKLLHDTTLMMVTPQRVSDLGVAAASLFWNSVGVPISPDSPPKEKRLLWDTACALTAQVLRMSGYNTRYVPRLPPNRVNSLVGNLSDRYGLDLYYYRVLSTITDRGKKDIACFLETVNYQPDAVVSEGRGVLWLVRKRPLEKLRKLLY